MKRSFALRSDIGSWSHPRRVAARLSGAALPRQLRRLPRRDPLPVAARNVSPSRLDESTRRVDSGRSLPSPSLMAAVNQTTAAYFQVHLKSRSRSRLGQSAPSKVDNSSTTRYQTWIWKKNNRLSDWRRGCFSFIYKKSITFFSRKREKTPQLTLWNRLNELPTDAHLLPSHLGNVH